MRVRLGITLLLLTLPLAGVASLAVFRFRENTMLETQASEIRTRMVDGGRELCESMPERFPRIGRELRRRMRRDGLTPPPRMRGIFAYSADFRSANERAPRLPTELVEPLVDGRAFSTRIAPDERGRPERQLLVRMPWDEGPCARVLVSRPHQGARPIDIMLPALLVALGTILVTLLAAGPIVGRIRRLTEAVRRAKGGGPLPSDDRHDELGELARTFAETQGDLREKMAAVQARDEALSEYIANTTHDVMLPLTVLQGHLLALRDRGNDEDQKLATLALEESHYLAALVRNLNAAARLDAGKVELRRDPVDLVDLVERVIQRHAPIARNKGVSLDHATPGEKLEVSGDLTLLEQAVSNLVHNAVRHNHEDGHVAVVLERGVDGAFSLVVLDDGPGADPAELARLTERGYRGDQARTLHPEGRGLGLAITREVVERHGFTLTFESPEEGGLRVTIAS